MYRIDLYPTRAEFSVDGRPTHTFDEGLPGGSMKLMVNAWYPEWPPGKKPESEGYTHVDRSQRNTSRIRASSLAASSTGREAF